MPSPPTETVEERSAGGVVIRHRDGVPHALIIRDPYKNWGLPKGHIEDLESPAQAALREVKEETGLEQVDVREELGTIDWWFHQNGVRIHKYCTFFLMTSQEGDPIPEEGEGISDCVWIPIEEAPDRVTYDNARAMVQEAAKRLSSLEGAGEGGEGNG